MHCELYEHQHAARLMLPVHAIAVADAGLVLQNVRVNFQFDRAAFTFNLLPFKLPYPVPFKLLGDETKVRASRHNKHNSPEYILKFGTPSHPSDVHLRHDYNTPIHCRLPTLLLQHETALTAFGTWVCSVQVI